MIIYIKKLYFWNDYLARRSMIIAIKLYQTIISPIKFYIFGPFCGCRFCITCSQYAITMYKFHNFFTASLLTFKRILQCNPLCKNIDE